MRPTWVTEYRRIDDVMIGDTVEYELNDGTNAFTEQGVVMNVLRAEWPYQHPGGSVLVMRPNGLLLGGLQLLALTLILEN